MEKHKQIHWTFDPLHCNIRFVARHLFISEVEGAFLSFTGTVVSDDEMFTNALIAFEIDAASLKTSSDIRDNNLRSENFFDVALYPKIRFQSLSFEKVLGTQYKLSGDLTIRNVTKTIEFDVQQNGIIEDADGKTKAGFKISGSVNRFDYNINFNRIVGNVIDVGSQIKLVCNIELFKQ